MAEKFAVVTGASTGIGYELAKLALADGYHVLGVADTPFTQPLEGAETVEIDLSTVEGVNKLLARIDDRRVDLLCANAGHGLGHAFLDQKVEDWKHVIDTNITGTLYLLQKVLPAMVARNEGKVLVTGSIAGYIPGSFQAVYNSSKSFVDMFMEALRNELKDADGVTLTTLMPGPVETEFFHRAELDDTKVGQDDNKSDPADVAKDGWDAVMGGKASIFSGWKTKLQGVMANVTPNAVLAGQHRNMAEPGSGET